MGFSPSDKHQTTSSIFSNIVDATTGSFTQGLTVSGVPVSTSAGQQRAYILLKDIKADGTLGGTFTAGDWRTRDLNTISHDDTGQVSLSSNQFVLPAGTYEITARAQAFACGRNKLRLRNITTTADVIIGNGMFAKQTSSSNTMSALDGKFTITSGTTFEFQHRCTVTQANQGLGVETTYGVEEVYAVVQLWKVT